MTKEQFDALVEMIEVICGEAISTSDWGARKHKAIERARALLVHENGQ